MFKLFFIYPLVLLLVFWLLSDVDIEASVYSMQDNSIAIEFPKQSLRSVEDQNPWWRFYWNADSGYKAL